MALTSSGQLPAIINSDYGRKIELKAFDDSKLGVKGLLDAGLSNIPCIFVTDELNLADSNHPNTSDSTILIIDFESINKDPSLRAEVVAKVRVACENWGLFQVLNHGVPDRVLEKMMAAVRGFHEQGAEVKKEFYSRDVNRKFTYNSNFDLHQSLRANWRDTIYCVMAPDSPDPEELPEICRDIMMEYSKYIMELGLILFELLSEALGLNPNHLKDMDCAEGLFLTGHYYPPCPEPELTLGLSNHTDSGFLTIVLQDQMGGLQVLHGNQWVDVPFLPGSLIVNIGDLLQLITNDKFKSVNHRVLAKNVGPRISVASFFRMHFQEGIASKLYGPMKELLSDENSPIYRETSREEYVAQRYSIGLNGTSLLSHFKLHNRVWTSKN